MCVFQWQSVGILNCSPKSETHKQTAAAAAAARMRNASTIKIYSEMNAMKFNSSQCVRDCVERRGVGRKPAEM